MKTILTIAGSDTSAGAGIQQDLKTITALGHYAVTVPTALTAQNTMGVGKVMTVPEDMLRAQLEAIRSDIAVDAIKIGMIPDTASARIITDYVRQFGVPTVCDPVMVSTSGTQLMADDCIGYVTRSLFPLCTLVTPNIPEAQRLLQDDGDDSADAMGRRLVSSFRTAFLLKGGHADGEEMRDTLFTADGTRHDYCSPRIATRNLHGTGCTMSSAVAALLAEGRPLPDAVAGAKEIINKGITQGRHLHIGHGNGPLWVG